LVMGDNFDSILPPDFIVSRAYFWYKPNCKLW
jgi:hypothetical protein